MLGGELAVPCNSQSALVRLNSSRRFIVVRFELIQVALKVGSCAAKNYKPRQVREEAAVSKNLWVPQGNLAGANCISGTCYYISKPGARFILFLKI